MVRTGQSLPQIIRPAPNRRTTWSKNGARVVASAPAGDSVSSPENLTATLGASARAEIASIQALPGASPICGLPK